jgi:hypothetical protein
MTAVRKELRRRRRPIGLAAMLVALTAVLVFAIGAQSGSLPGSHFEIDGVLPTTAAGSNLIVNGPDPDAIDWVGQSEIRRVDLDSGRDDDSYAGGSKEDDACPGTTTGSIPNNKSDLKTFGAYVEPEADGPGFLNLFWHRVNDPSGTTLMDFELNHESTLCANGVNPIRTEGDLLIEYRIDQGGAVGTVKVREWSGSAWGAAVDLTGTQAIATIQNVSIPAAQSDGLILTGSMAPRTFGEMQLDLDFVFDEDSCESFGSAFVKSRSSDSFTSQLKDFIKPIPVNISNCGQVIIRKQTEPDGATALFDYDKSFPTDPPSVDEFQLADDGVQTYDGVIVGSGYTVDEDLLTLPAGWEFDSLDCSDSSTGTEYVVTDANVTFDIGIGDTLDCTYTNRLNRGAILITKTRKHAADGPGDHPHEGVSFTVNGVTQQTDANGQTCFDDLPFSEYTVHEDVPAGYHVDENDKVVAVDNNATCSDDPYGGEEVAFSNTPLTDVTVSVDSQVDGGTASDIDCDDGTSGSTGADGDGSVTVNDLEPTAPAVTLTCTITIDP